LFVADERIERLGKQLLEKLTDRASLEESLMNMARRMVNYGDLFVETRPPERPKTPLQVFTEEVWEDEEKLLPDHYDSYAPFYRLIEEILDEQ
jgi:hypothetical protein